MTFGMGHSMGCYTSQHMKQTLSHAHKLQLKQLLELKQTLLEPEYPQACKGLEGMLIAHNLLQQTQAVGLLIGGLSEAIWNQRCKVDDLKNKHKDVDVMVLPYKDTHNQLDDDIPISRFAGGVDWWLPHEERLTIYISDSSQRDANQRYWKNGNNAILAFGISQQYNLAPGLYIPNRDWIVRMRTAEILALVDTQRIEIEQEAFDAYTKKIESQLKTRVPSFIRTLFEKNILSYTYHSGGNSNHTVEAITLQEFDHPTYYAINKSEGKIWGEEK